LSFWFFKIVKKKRFDPDLVSTEVLNEIDVVEMKYPVRFFSNIFDFLSDELQARCTTLPTDLQGDTFQCIYGANQLALEYVLIDKKLKGPCWLNIKNCGL
jgi:hypothetical protein